jgi:ribosomal protein L37E
MTATRFRTVDVRCERCGRRGFSKRLARLHYYGPLEDLRGVCDISPWQLEVYKNSHTSRRVRELREQAFGEKDVSPPGKMWRVIANESTGPVELPCSRCGLPLRVNVRKLLRRWEEAGRPDSLYV